MMTCRSVGDATREQTRRAGADLTPCPGAASTNGICYAPRLERSGAAIFLGAWLHRVGAEVPTFRPGHAHFWLNLLHGGSRARHDGAGRVRLGRQRSPCPTRTPFDRASLPTFPRSRVRTTGCRYAARPGQCSRATTRTQFVAVASLPRTAPGSSTQRHNFCRTLRSDRARSDAWHPRLAHGHQTPATQ